MGAFIDITGQKFGRMTVLGRGTNFGPKTGWDCICDCGNKQTVRGTDLTLGKHKSCGCLQRESVTTHNKTSCGKVSPAYRSWLGMRTRCGNPRFKMFARYGGRGITVCPEWNTAFEAFLADMGEPPTPKHTLDRINNDGNYEPGNCRWATRAEQAKNRTWSHPKIPRQRNAKGQFV